MSTPTNGGAPANPEAAQVVFRVLTQYIKDFSFENPNAPKSILEPQQQQPAINIQINVNPRQLSNTDFEIELKLEGKAEHAGVTLFGFDLAYCGVFRLMNIPAESVGPLVMIEAPRMLFPFAREIIASAIIGGGFPPLLLDPVDFVALYQQKAAQMQQQAGGAATA